VDSRTFCSQFNPAEPLAGTADTVGVWLLLEYRPVWKARALQDNGLAEHIRAWLERSVASLAQVGVRARPQFVRRPENEREQLSCLVGLPGTLLEFSGVGYDWLEGLDLSAVVRNPAASGGRVIAEPQYFVCTNGQRDVCCARFGLPSYAALRDRVGERAWQVTHLGGHRFAPNVLVLPQGALYGRVTPDAVPSFLDAVEADALAFAHLRGRSFQPAHVQAAEAFAGRSDLRLLHVDGDAARARVRFAAPDGVVEIGVARSAEGVQMQASCGDEATELVFPYVRS